MNGNRLLIDTNILIYLSKKELSIDDFAGESDVLYLSVISYMEAKGYPFINKQEESIIDKLCENLIKVHLSENIIETVVSLRKQNKIKLPDAIILASAIEHNLKLITRNIKDFESAAPLDILLNPFRE
jgi:predicted nucleic acid-binding protein